MRATQKNLTSLITVFEESRKLKKKKSVQSNMTMTAKEDLSDSSSSSGGSDASGNNSPSSSISPDSRRTPSKACQLNATQAKTVVSKDDELYNVVLQAPSTKCCTTTATKKRQRAHCSSNGTNSVRKTFKLKNKPKIKIDVSGRKVCDSVGRILEEKQSSDQHAIAATSIAGSQRPQSEHETVVIPTTVSD